jgi:hypothetical protein
MGRIIKSEGAGTGRSATAALVAGRDSLAGAALDICDYISAVWHGAGYTDSQEIPSPPQECKKPAGARFQVSYSLTSTAMETILLRNKPASL